MLEHDPTTQGNDVTSQGIRAEFEGIKQIITEQWQLLSPTEQAAVLVELIRPVIESEIEQPIRQALEQPETYSYNGKEGNGDSLASARAT